jgi:hypothetical protein
LTGADAPDSKGQPTDELVAPMNSIWNWVGVFALLLLGLGYALKRSLPVQPVKTPWLQELSSPPIGGQGPYTARDSEPNIAHSPAPAISRERPPASNEPGSQPITRNHTVTYSEQSPNSASTATNEAGIIRRLWRGEVPLVQAYWLYGGLVNTLLAKLVAALARSVPELTLLWWAFWTLCMAYVVVTIVAIWRSSKRYTGPRIWATLARVSVVLGVGISVVEFVVSFVGAM